MHRMLPFFIGQGRLGALLCLGVAAGCARPPVAPAHPTPVQVQAEAPESVPPASSSFITAPYLQLGDHAGSAEAGRLRLLFETAPTETSLVVEARSGTHWVPAKLHRRVLAGLGCAAYAAWNADLPEHPPGSTFPYRVRRVASTAPRANGTAPEVLLEASAHVPPGRGSLQRFFVVGDIGVGSAGQRKVAWQIHQARPDYGVLTGDLVYPYGQLADYRSRLHPVYNADQADAEHGAPLLREVVVAAAPGNHDLGTRDLAMLRDLSQRPDALAYFYQWDQPLNGPMRTAAQPGAVQPAGATQAHAAFLRAAGPRYPQMSCFSFDRGDVHWTVLDSNDFVPWHQPALQAWLRRDLEGARAATWRLVAFHHPGFHSSSLHSTEQQMRILSPLFEELGVDVVFSGHVHGYERTRPLRFRPLGTAPEADGQVSGRLEIDTRFDGKQSTHPHGVVYITTGAGGAHLYGHARDVPPAFTAAREAGIHSFTLCEVSPTQLTLQQIGEGGRLLDTMRITHDSSLQPPPSTTPQASMAR